MAREQLVQLRAEIFAHVVGVHAVRELAVRSREQRDAALGEQRSDRAQVGRGIGEVLDDLEAHHRVEPPGAERQARDLGAAERGACGAILRVGRHAVDADDARSRAREQRRARPAAAAEVEHARTRDALGRELVRRAVAREVDREQRLVVVEALAGKADLAQTGAVRASWSASRVSSRAKHTPIAVRSAMIPNDSTRLIASSRSAGARSLNR